MRKKIIKSVWRNFLWQLTGLSAGMVLILVFFQAPVIAGDIENKLSTNNGTTAFEIQDSDGKVVSQIDSIGRVGMGITNPQGKLHILSDSTTDPYVFVTSHTTSGYGVVVSTTSNVGIGTTDPTAYLDLAPATTSKASLRLQSGTAPSSPNTGDIYSDGTDLHYYNGSSWDDLTAVGFSSLASVYLSAGQTIPSGTWTKVNFSTESYDVNNEFDTSTYKFTAAEGGYYSITAQVTFSEPIERVGTMVKKNGSEIISIYSHNYGSGGGLRGIVATKDVKLVSGDYIEVFVVQNSGVAQTCQNSAARTFFTIHRFK